MTTQTLTPGTLPCGTSSPYYARTRLERAQVNVCLAPCPNRFNAPCQLDPGHRGPEHTNGFSFWSVA
jgi:hypothetical protein